jgi:hypothetical protein
MQPLPQFPQQPLLFAQPHPAYYPQPQLDPLQHNHYAPYPTLPHFGYYLQPPHNYYGYPPPAGTPVPRSTEPSSTFSSPGAAVTRNVSLDSFCTKYGISDSDKQKLLGIEYKPGNKIVESLQDSEWRTAGFSVLGWKGFLAAHRKFCQAVKEDKWEE